MLLRPVALKRTLSQLIDDLSRLSHVDVAQSPYAQCMAMRLTQPVLMAFVLLGMQSLVPFAPVLASPHHVQIYSRRMEALFIRMDVNGDGRLESGEVRGRPYFERRLQRPDSRGYLLLKDLRALSPHPSGQRLQKRFNQADRNGDGRIDRRECQSLPWLSRNFVSFDLDADGGLTLEELWTVQRSLAPRH